MIKFSWGFGHKKIITLCFHEDFRAKAERHFFATVHSKGPWDRVGRTS